MRSPAAALALACALTACPVVAADDPAAALPGEAALSPLRRAGTIERHTPETLWERIDGEAELYRTYGLTASAHARYALPADEDRRVEVSIFTFADPLGAFGVFAAFRPPAGTGELPVGSGGCLQDDQGFFWQGAIFVLADGAGPAATRSTDLRRALEAVAAGIGAAPRPPSALQEFSRVAEASSIRYQPQHLLGRDALPPGLEGVAAGTPIFVSVATTTGELPGAALARYARALEGATLGDRDGHRVLVGRDPVLGPVVLIAAGGGIAGARSSPDAAGVREVLRTLVRLIEDEGARPAR